MSENKEIQVKLYFSDLKNVLSFLSKQRPFENLENDWVDFICDFTTKDGPLPYREEILEPSELLTRFVEKWTGISEHVNNLILIMENYLEQDSNQEKESTKD